MRAIIAGAGPAGFACAKWLSDRGYDVVLVEKRAVPGGKVSAWRDADGDWVESGLHVFFGAYHNLLSFLAECGLEDSFDWKPAEMLFASPEHGLAPIRFVPGLPAPLNGLAGVAISPLMSSGDKLRMALGLLRPIFGSQAYIDAQDDQSYAAWHLRHAMGQRTLDDVMHTMTLALNFQRADKVSAKLVLTALLHFAQETHAPKMGLVKGSPHERLWAPLTRLLSGRGVTIVLGRKVDHICYDTAANRVTGFALDDGSTLEGDIYISAMPVHSLRKRLAPALKQQPPFDGLRHLKGQPVITAQLYFDRMVTEIDHLLFSAGTHLSVYADLPRVSPDYHTGRGPATHSTSPSTGLGGASGQANSGRGPSTSSGRGHSTSSGRGSIVELVVAPAEHLIGQSDELVLRQVLSDFYRMHPAARDARLTKYTLVRIPNSVYQARPGVDQFRPDQATPVPNLFLAGDFTQQEFMASIEGAVRSAKRAVERIDRVGDGS